MSMTTTGIYDLSDRPLPRQDMNLVLLVASRFLRSQSGMSDWAKIATQSVDFYEGRQWTAEDLRKLQDEKRPALTINKIRPLINLAMGYHLNNQTHDRFMPGHDGTGTAEIAAALSAVTQQIDEMNESQFIDAEVFLDGLLTGRGFYDIRLDFSKNALGNVAVTAQDPFATYLDPDGDKYDINSGNYASTSRWVSIDEIYHHYGQMAADWVRPLVGGMSAMAMPGGIYNDGIEITPWRNFGGDQFDRGVWGVFTDQLYDWVDTYRKTVRLIDMQHWQQTNRWFFVDMDTGDQKAIPDSWDSARIERVMMWAQQERMPLVVQRKSVRRLRWTHLIGDIIVFDEWSPYDSMTLVPYFPYFRRGMTQGMVEPLIDSNREINVRRSARQNIVGRSSNSGWMVPEGGLTPEELENLEKNGGRPGFILKYKTLGPNGTTLSEPKQITPQQTPISIAELEKESASDLPEIAGINKASLGQVEQSNISGRAIKARQQQTVIGLEGFMANYRRSKRMMGSKKLELIQGYYTEQRIIRVTGKGRSPAQVVINQKTAAGIVNDVTLGQYSVKVDETSLSESFLEGQFNELMTMKAAGMPIPDEFVVEASSLGRKEELLAMMQAQREAMAAAGIPAGDAPGSKANGTGPGGSAVGPDGGSMPG